MKAVSIFLMVFLLTAGVYITEPDILFASEETESEGEIIDGSEVEERVDSELEGIEVEERVDSELEGIEVEERVDMDDYLRILDEERQESELEDQSDDLNDKEKEYQDDIYIDDRR